MSKKPISLDEKRWKKTSNEVLGKLERGEIRPEDVEIKMHERMIAKPGCLALSISFSMAEKKKDGKDSKDSHKGSDKSVKRIDARKPSANRRKRD
jgi:hypothetical protein